MRFASLLLVLPAAATLPCLAADTRDGTSPETTATRVRWQLVALLPAPRAPAAPLRVALDDTVELRADGAGLTLAAAPASTPRTDVNDAVDLADRADGPRWRVRAGRISGLPGTALLGSEPVDARAFAHAGIDPRASARITAEWTLAPDLALAVTPGLLVDRDEDGHRHASGLVAVALDKAWTTHWRGALAVAGRSGTGANAGAVPLSLDAGLAYRATDALQLEVALSHGVAGGAPELQGGVGLAARF